MIATLVIFPLYPTPQSLLKHHLESLAADMMMMMTTTMMIIVIIFQILSAQKPAQYSNKRYLYRKQVKILTKTPVISPLSLFLEVKVCFQLIFIFPCCTVNPLEHWPIYIPSPVSTSNRFKLNSFPVNISGGFNMRPSTKIPPLISYKLIKRKHYKGPKITSTNFVSMDFIPINKNEI